VLRRWLLLLHLTDFGQWEYAKIPTGDYGNMLLVYLLGTPFIAINDHPLTIPRRQVRSLFYYLAANNTLIPRERLAFLYWPDTPENTARRNLNRLIPLLRKSLPDPNLIMTLGDQVSLNHQKVWVDVHDFKTKGSSEGKSVVAQAVELYRGRFLEGFSLPACPEFEVWIRQEARHMERCYLSTLARLIELHREEKDFKSAIGYAQRYLDCDETAEEIHRKLIELHVINRDRNAAIRQYEQCRDVLQREFGVEPLPETEDLFRSIFNISQIDSPAPKTDTVRPKLLQPEVPLVGRGENLQELERTFQQVEYGDGCFMMIAGEAGIGKSRLLLEFIANIKPGALILGAGADPGTQTLSYGPILESLRAIPLDIYQACGISPVWLNEAARLLPDLKSLIPDRVTPAATDEQGNPRLFEALSQILLSLIRENQALILWLEDLHWADSTTLEWLAYFGGKIRQKRVLILGTYRSDDIRKLTNLRQSLSRQNILVDLSLSGLTRSDVHEIAGHLEIPTSENDQIIEQLWRVTAGNPFFLTEVLKDLVEKRLTQNLIPAPDQLPIPGTVQAAIESRLDHLSPTALQVLQASAVLGISFEFPLLYHTAGRSELETVEALDELAWRKLLATVDQDYRFRHELIQAVVYQKMGAWRRRILHRRAAEWLEVEQLDSLNALGFHYERAGDEHTQKAITYLLRAGDRARQFYGYKEAIDLYERALALLKQQGDNAEFGRVTMKIALAHQNAFRFEQARQAYKQAFEVWRRTDAPDRNRLLRPAPHPLRYAFADKRGPTYLDPPKAWEDGSLSIINQLFRGLVSINHEMDIIPDGAEKWQVSEGGRVYLFELREDLSWSDGAPVTAYDYEYAWKRALDPGMEDANITSLWDVKGAIAYYQGKLPDPEAVGVRALDQYRLLVELEAPTPYFPQALSHNATLPVPRHLVERYGEDWLNIENIVSNGPFLLESWQRDSRLTLSQNTTYQGSRNGNVYQVEMMINQDFDSLLEYYEANQLDILVISGASIEDRMKVKKQFSQDLRSLNLFGTFFVGFDVSRPPFDDVRLRQAFAHAIDRQFLGKSILGEGKVAAEGGFVPPEIPGHSKDIGLSYNSKRAARLMKEAGYLNGKEIPEIDALVPRGLVAYGSYLQKQWQDVLGMDVQWQAVEWKTFNNRTLYDPPNMFLTPWFGAYPDPDAYLRTCPFRQISRWQNEEYEDLVEAGTRSSEQGHRIACYQAADRMLMREAIMIPFLYTGKDFLMKPWIKSFAPATSKWWVWNDIVIEPHS
jgi:ABC-type oligopeptide transport system substrate-binding subunit/DNA-binding SARP family transcriptional activator